MSVSRAARRSLKARDLFHFYFYFSFYLYLRQLDDNGHQTFRSFRAAIKFPLQRYDVLDFFSRLDVIDAGIIGRAVAYDLDLHG